MSCDFAHHDGAYVLGSLSPAERQDFEEHLPWCPDCAEAVRQLAGLPGLLALVPVDVLDPPSDDAPLPDTLLPSLVREVRRIQLRRRLVMTGTAAAAALVVAVAFLVGIGGLPWSSAPPGTSVVAGPPADHRMVSIDQESVRADVGFETVPWGTKVALVCTYAAPGSHYSVPPSTTYALVVRTRDGRSQQVATWRALPGKTMQVAAATAVARTDIAAVEVRTADGSPVLQWSR